MEFLLALLPAAGCAALMLVCFRMMRNSKMHGEPENHEVTAPSRTSRILARGAQANAIVPVARASGCSHAGRGGGPAAA